MELRADSLTAVVESVLDGGSQRLEDGFGNLKDVEAIEQEDKQRDKGQRQKNTGIGGGGSHGAYLSTF